LDRGKRDLLLEHDQIGDIATLDRIAIFIGQQPGSSKDSVSEKHESKPKLAAPNNFLVDCAQLCATLAQTTALLDPKHGPSDPGLSESTFLVHG
jgi:hypothetical protein